MTASELSKILGYPCSPSWYDGDRLRDLARRDHAVSRTIRACRHEGGGLWGAYLLGDRSSHTNAVYVLDAPSNDAAERVHRLIWNQDVAPFILMATDDGVRVCTGFRYAAPGQPEAQRGVLHAALSLSEVGRLLDDLRAEHIDTGMPWRRRAAELSGERRVDALLLKNLERLRENLLRDGLATHMAHALIGRFLYVRHLRDRGLLDAMRIDPRVLSDAIGRATTVRKLRRLVEAIDARLNGSVFPVEWTGKDAPEDRHVQALASTFLGDDPHSGQQHLSFEAFDFSYLPVETLSVVYEQFLTHLDEAPASGRRGRSPVKRPTRREAGVVYTPLPLVNFVLDEVDDARPMTSTTRVLDPSCGSGAFLVQSYQRLVSQWQQERPGEELTAGTLRALLTDNIFGIDRDPDACRVAEFSLLLALLDRLPCPELSLASGFKLPTLHDRNIFVGDFFDPSGAWRTRVEDGFDWIIGNPPWISSAADGQGHARAWMKRNHSCPVAERRVAEAFAWEARAHLRAQGCAGLVLEGMTLFSDSERFRRAFFGAVRVASVTNFANLREVLFDGRARVPAAVLVYGPLAPAPDAVTCVCSPLMVNQIANVGPPGRRARIWTLCLNQSEVMVLPQRELMRGDALTYKLAMWGSPRDARLVQRLKTRPGKTLASLEARWVSRQGALLCASSSPSAVFTRELVGRSSLQRKALDGERQVFSLPEGAISRPMTASNAYINKTKGPTGIEASHGDHVIVGADFSFAVYQPRFLLAPHPLLSVAVPEEDRHLAKMLALYLNSRVVRYFLFMVSPQEGVKSGRITLTGLRALPLPFFDLSSGEQRAWVELHDRLAASSTRRWSLKSDAPGELDPAWVRADEEHRRLIDELEAKVGSALGLRPQERWLVDDLLDVKLRLVDSLTGSEVTVPPDLAALRAYADTLRDTMDAFYEGSLGVRHTVTIIRTRDFACAELTRASGRTSSVVVDAETEVARALGSVYERVRRETPQWIYFDRNLMVFDADKVCIFKPLQVHAWTRARALADADALIAEGIAAGGHA